MREPLVLGFEGIGFYPSLGVRRSSFCVGVERRGAECSTASAQGWNVPFLGAGCAALAAPFGGSGHLPSSAVFLTSGGGGGPATVELPETDTETRTAEDRLWNVIVWDDPINLMSYVTYVFQKLFGYSQEVATRLMLEVHQKGRSIVATVEREKAEYYVGRLHHYGLQATLEKQVG